jgi:hypothetical protein
MRDKRCIQDFSWEYLRDIHRLEYLGAYGVIILKMYSKQTGCDYVNWVHPDEDGKPVSGVCEHGNEPWCSAKCLEYRE